MKPTPKVDMAGEESINGNFTAIPKSTNSLDADAADSGVDFGEMNEADARESGYTDADGEAVELARPDIEGSPTGAFTDLGAGRSGVVHKKH